MNWIYFVLLILLSMAGFFIGFRYIGLIKSMWWIVIAALSLGLIILYVIFRFYPVVEYHLIPLWIYPFTEIISFIPFALLFFGIATRKAPRKFLAIEVAFIALLVFVYGLIRVNWIYLDNGVDRAKFRIDNNGVCIQSTGYTCAPASAVTLLKYYGIDANEKEMAYLAHTRNTLGTEIIPLARALQEKTNDKGLKVDIISANWQSLKAFNQPCLVNLKWNVFVDHVVTVLGIEDDKVIIADPLSGKEKWDKDDFLNKWRGSVIVITRN